MQEFQKAFMGLICGWRLERRVALTNVAAWSNVTRRDRDQWIKGLRVKGQEIECPLKPLGLSHFNPIGYGNWKAELWESEWKRVALWHARLTFLLCFCSGRQLR